MAEKDVRQTYREILADWRLGQIGLVYALAAASFVVFLITGEIAQAGFISTTVMAAIRAPVLAAAIIVWAWVLSVQVRKLVA